MGWEQAGVWVLRAVCGLGTEAVQRWVLGADVSTWGGDRLVGEGARACIDCVVRRATVSWGPCKNPQPERPAVWEAPSAGSPYTPALRERAGCILHGALETSRQA